MAHGNLHGEIEMCIRDSLHSGMGSWLQACGQPSHPCCLLYTSIQPNAYELDIHNSTVAFFNDSIRDGLKGFVFSTEDTGFASSKPNTEGLILNNMLGCQNPEGISKGSFCTNGNANVKYGNAGQIVNYVEIHDNLTLNDKLNVSLFGKKTDDELDAAQKTEKITVSKLDDSAVFLAHGVSEFQVGQEMPVSYTHLDVYKRQG